MKRSCHPVPGGVSRTKVADRDPAPWPSQSDPDRSAEQLATHFGLGYLSAEGFEKLAMLIAWVVDRERKRTQAPEELKSVPNWRVG